MASRNHDYQGWASFVIIAILAICGISSYIDKHKISSGETSTTTGINSTWSNSQSLPQQSNQEYNSSSYGLYNQHVQHVYYPENTTYAYSSSADTPDDAFDEGYEEGYEQGRRDGGNGHSHGYGYDDSNSYYDYYDTRYCEGYEEGYDDGYSTGESEYDEEEDEDEW